MKNHEKMLENMRKVNKSKFNNNQIWVQIHTKMAQIQKIDQKLGKNIENHAKIVLKYEENR